MIDQTETFRYREITAEGVAATVEAALADAEALVAAAVAAADGPDPRFADVVGRLDRALGDLWDANGRTGFMVHVHPDEAVRAAAQEATELVTSWQRSLPLRDDVAAAVSRYAATACNSPRAALKS